MRNDDAMARNIFEDAGVTRFFSDQQEEIYSVVKPTMIVSFAIFAVLAGCHNWLESHRKGKATWRILDALP